MTDNPKIKIDSGKPGKKARQLNIEDLLSNDIRKLLSNDSGEVDINKMGFNGENIPNCSPTYVPLKRAKVLKKYDSYIVLGADAPNGPGSGYSSFGARCSAIDMVVGRLSSNIKASTNPELYCVDNYNLDAARIYISQRTDVDENFQIKKGNVGESVCRSAIAAKADAIRIIGREGIKLVTSPHGDYNSQSGKLSSGYGIDLMARNDDSDLQPIPKGDNLALALNGIIGHIQNIYGTIFEISKSQMDFALKMAAHTHTSAAGPVAPSVELTPAAMALSKNIMQVGVLDTITERLNSTLEELESLYSLGYNCINSDDNRTN